MNMKLKLYCILYIGAMYVMKLKWNQLETVKKKKTKRLCDPLYKNDRMLKIDVQISKKKCVMKWKNCCEETFLRWSVDVFFVCKSKTVLKIHVSDIVSVE
jgi:HD superfamily phosphodiesterase